MSKVMTVGGRPFSLATSGGAFQLNESSAQAPVGAPVFTLRGNAGLTVDGSGGVTGWADSVGSLAMTPASPDRPATQITSPGGTAAVRIDSGGGLIGPATGLPSGAALRTVMIAVRFWGSPFFGGFGYGSDTSDQAFTLSVDNNGRMGLDYFNGRVDGSLAVPGQWIVLHATYDGTTITYGEDGVDIASATVALSTGLTQVNIGRSFGGSTTECDLGEANIWAGVLSPAEIATEVARLRDDFVIDAIAPTVSGALLRNATSVSLDLAFTLDEECTVWALAETNATAPTAATIKATGTQLDNVPIGETELVFDGLPSSTTHYGKVYAEDLAGNPSSVIVTSGASTDAPDTTAPVLGNGTIAATGPNTYSLSYDTDEANGTRFHVISDAATAPSAAEVIAGQKAGGAAANASGSASVMATGLQAASGAGLSGGTTYYGFAAHRDAAGNISAVLSLGSFTTTTVVVGQPEGFSVVGDWARIPNIVGANYAPPAHNKTANPSNLTTVVAGAVDGDVIRFDDGSYSNTEINGLRPATGVTFAAQSYRGAVFSDFGLYNCANVTVMGIRATDRIDVQKCDASELDYCVGKRLDWGARDRTGFLAYSFRSLPANSGGIVRRTLIDQEWNNGACGKIQAAIIGDTDNLQVLNSLFIRGSEDSLKIRGVKVGTIREVFTGWARVDENCHDSSNSSTDYHGDSAQFEGYSGWENEDILIELSAFVSPSFSGYRTSQGLFMKDGTHRRYTIRNVIGSASLNGNSIVTEEFHNDTLIENCDAFYGVVRCSGSSNTVRNSVYRFLQIESGFSGPSQSGNVTYGSPANILNVYQGTDRADFDSYLLQGSVDQTKGAADLKALVIARRAAAA
ncbi:MAG: LamG-like jellyroll fold domain-containing protein [Pseudomonadota bacterium]